MHQPGVPLALEKLEGPATSIIFHGITLHTARMEIGLLQVKLLRIQESLSKWLGNKSATKKLREVVGLLQHAARVIRCGHTFMAWMYATAAKVKEGAPFLHQTRQRVSIRYCLVAQLDLVAGMVWVCFTNSSPPPTDLPFIQMLLAPGTVVPS